MKSLAYDLQIHATTKQSFLMMSSFKVSSNKEKELVCQVFCLQKLVTSSSVSGEEVMVRDQML